MQVTLIPMMNRFPVTCLGQRFLATSRVLHEPGWVLLQRVQHSRSVVSSNFHLFKSLRNSFNGVAYTYLDAVKNHTNDTFSSATEHLYADQICKLPQRRTHVLTEMKAALTMVTRISYTIIMSILVCVRRYSSLYLCMCMYSICVCAFEL